jgi:hypothetical protein
VNGEKIARFLAGLAVLAVAVVAGIVSFSHIETLALAHGYALGTARLLPVSVDGLIVAASLALITGARAQQETPRLARAGLVLGIVATVLANVAAGARYGLTGEVVNAWPAVAFIVASEILLHMVRGPQGVPGVDGATGTVAAPLLADEPVPVPEIVPVDTTASTVYPAPARPVRAVSARVPSRSPAAKARTPERIFAAEIQAGEVPSIRTIKARAKCGTPRAQEIRNQLAGAMWTAVADQEAA